MISLLFDTFSLRLFAAAHVAVLSISCWYVPVLADGTIIMYSTKVVRIFEFVKVLNIVLIVTDIVRGS